MSSFSKGKSFRKTAHLIEKVSELFLSLYNLLPMFYLLVFDVLLLQPENTRM